MTKKRIVLALGGNAILVDDPSAKAQKSALEETSKYLVDLVKEGHEVLISHGNGPQVGNLWLQQLAANSPQNPILPLDTCVAMTQGSIGYWLQNAMQQTLAKEKLEKQVVSLVTQVVVSEADPAFQAPTKPIGPFYSEAEMVQQKATNGGDYMEDAGRGFRKVVPSPKPQRIQEYPVIRQLLENGHLVIAAGGGGIPVVETKDGLVGVEAVIDKDFAAEKLAELIEADLLIILTGVPQIFVHFNQPNQAALANVSAAEMTGYMEAGQFPAGSMLPKVEAALAFVQSNPNGRVLITDLAHVGEAIKGNGGTWIHA